METYSHEGKRRDGISGHAIPVESRLVGEQGLSISASGYPRSQAQSCGAAAPKGSVEETVSAGSSSLSYDAATDQDTYVWKTERAWAGTCLELTLRLSDNTEHKAQFRFTN